MFIVLLLAMVCLIGWKFTLAAIIVLALLAERN